MPLPDVSRLSRLSPDQWSALAARLRAVGVRLGEVAKYASIGEKIPDPMRGPMRRWHLRRDGTPFGFALRAFLFGDAVTESEALEVVGSRTLFDALLDAGMLVRVEDERLVCPFLVNVINDLFVICDDLSLGGEAVMGAGATTGSLCQAAYPLKPVARALDLGCGAGTAALLLASRAEHVVGVDINPRAIALSRANALFNGIDNVEFREGDLFAPVAGERFDVIVSQPPFVSQPDEEPGAVFLHGGRRGDELVLRALRELPPMLAPGGRAIVLIDWPRVDERSIGEYVREALGEGPNLLCLLSTPKDLDSYCTFYAAGRFRTLGPEFERAATAHREHLARVGIRELRFAFLIVEETRGRSPWTATVPIKSLSDVDPTSTQIEKLVAARHLLAGPIEALADARLRVPEGTTFVDQGNNRVLARLPEDGLVASIACNAAAARLLSDVTTSPNVGAVVSELARRVGAPEEVIRGRVLAGVRDALEKGLLEVEVSPPASS